MSEREMSGDRNAEIIYARVRRLVFHLLGPDDALDDVVQMAMEEFIKSKIRWRGEGTVEAFADGIAANIAKNWMRKQSRAAFWRDLVSDTVNWPVLPAMGQAPAEPAEHSDSRDRLRRVMRLLQRMKPDYRMAWVLYSVEGKTVEQIAEMESITVSAVRSRILRARRDLHARGRKDPVLAEWLDSLGAKK